MSTLEKSIASHTGQQRGTLDKQRGTLDKQVMHSIASHTGQQRGTLDKQVMHRK